MIPRHLFIGIAAMLIAVATMTFFVRRMKHRVLDLPAASSDTRPIAPPATGPTEQVTLYVAYDDPGTIRAVSAQIPLPVRTTATRGGTAACFDEPLPRSGIDSSARGRV